MNREKIRKHLQAFEFDRLFNELGWDRANPKHTVRINDQSYELQAVAQKRGFIVFVCPTLPDYATRVKIESELTKSFRENLLIFFNPDKTEQRWLWTKREVGKPMARRERAFQKGDGHTGESILQALQGIEFTLAEEEGVTLTDVSSRVRATFDLERVTKKFYDRFKREHDVFMGFIEGIPDEDLQQWYASVMLNRLMFVYFIQNKNFLNNDTRYLQNRLVRTQGNFYREFLLPLFFDGFSNPNKSPATRALLGDVPYLNGGIFMPHSIEQQYGDALTLPNTAFEKIFAFFDSYRWHLDERPLRRDDEINPDVLGYIFEKYINQKQMGAYYTKEDITEYISKNTIIPFLFDQAQKGCAVAFKGDFSVWRIAQDDPNRYIYEAVRHGVTLALPEEIAKGLEDVAQRQAWNTPTPPTHGLPTEIWRETVARRQRYADVRSKLENGEVRSIHDFITYNLDIRQFAQDVIQYAESSDLVKAFWKAITEITVLGPTCGSGAFLFAALNILEPLYEACLERMDTFLREPERGKRYAEFEGIKAQIDQHPNRSYFILKSIILNNLYGVDIMEEAIEICKLRLFLKLVAQEDNPKRIEPLPDIDFNIRAGNTLVGFATKSEVENNLFAREILPVLEVLTGTLNTFRDEQLKGNIPADQLKDLKARINAKRLEFINILDKALAPQHGFGTDQLDRFRASHQPFHWYAEFYNVLSNGGFDVIIGNPPYVEYSKVRNEYTLQGYETESAGNLYAFVMERSISLLQKNAKCGMIIPISAFSNNSMKDLRILISQYPIYISTFHQRPAQLFEGVLQRLSIFLLDNIIELNPSIKTTSVIRWYSSYRPFLFQTFRYLSTHVLDAIEPILKFGSDIELSIARKLYSQQPINRYVLDKSTDKTSNSVSYRTAGGGYWWTFLLGGFDTKSLSNKTAKFKGNYNSKIFSAALNSSLFWWYYFSRYDLFNLKDYMIFSFPLDYPANLALHQVLLDHADSLEESLLMNAVSYVIQSKTRGDQQTFRYETRKSKPIIDEIDRVLAEHYGFTDEELDFIINYDIKYRMGDELGGEDGDA